MPNSGSRPDDPEGADYLYEELLEKLRTDPAIFEWIEQGSLDGMWYWDIEDGHWEWLSPRFKEVFGYEEHEVPNTSAWWQENIFPEDLPAVLETAKSHFEDGTPYDQIVRYRHKNGSTVWVRCRGLAIRNESGQPIRMLGAHTDVTELKQTELALRRTNETLRQFAHVASHDLRAPLRGIRHLTDWVREDVGDALNEKAAGHLEQLETRVLRLEGLIEGMLAYVRGASSAAGAELAPVKPSALLEHLREEIGTERLQLAVEHGGEGADEPMLTHGAPLQRVLDNLVHNAVEHSDREPARVVVRFERPGGGNRLRVSVEDDGPGVPRGMQRTLFQPFRSSHSVNTAEVHGLGLAIARRLCHDRGGDLSHEAVGERGARFVVDWPLEPLVAAAY